MSLERMSIIPRNDSLLRVLNFDTSFITLVLHYVSSVYLSSLALLLEESSLRSPRMRQNLTPPISGEPTRQSSER